MVSVAPDASHPSVSAQVMRAVHAHAIRGRGLRPSARDYEVCEAT